MYDTEQLVILIRRIVLSRSYCRRWRDVVKESVRKIFVTLETTVSPTIQAPVVQRADNFIQWITRYPAADKMYSNHNFYLLDIDLSAE